MPLATAAEPGPEPGEEALERRGAEGAEHRRLGLEGVHQLVVDRDTALHRLLQGAPLLGGDDPWEVGVGGVLLRHRVEVVDEDARAPREGEDAAHPRIAELDRGDLVPADGVDEDHRRQEAVLVPVHEVSPHLRGPSRGAPPRLLAVGHEHDRQLAAQPGHLGRGRVEAEALEARAQRPEHGILGDPLLEPGRVVDRQLGRVDHRLGEGEPLPDEVRLGAGPLVVDVMVVDGPFAQRAARRREQPVGVVAVGVGEHDQPPEVRGPDLVEAAGVDAGLPRPGDEPLVHLPSQGGVVADRRRAVELGQGGHLAATCSPEPQRGGAETGGPVRRAAGGMAGRGRVRDRGPSGGHGEVPRGGPSRAGEQGGDEVGEPVRGRGRGRAGEQRHRSSSLSVSRTL